MRKKLKRLTSKISENEFSTLTTLEKRSGIAIMTKPFSCNLMPLTIFFQLHHHDIYCLQRVFRVRLREKYATRPRLRR